MTGWTWKHREAQRLRRGTYGRLPFDGQSWYQLGPGPKQHYAHISREDPTKIAYTESEEKGKKDQQIRTRPGRYLKRFYSDILSENQIRDFATEVTSKVKDNDFKIAMEPSEIEHVYRNGPDSCMSYGLSSFDSEIHPVRIYGAGDLGVAYLERKGRITARALCWPDRKRYTRIYGDSVRLSGELNSRGFTQHGEFEDDSSAFDGARLLKIEEKKYNRNNFVVPYVDYHRCMREEGEHLVLCEDGPLTCGQTNGLVPVCRGVKCNNCHSWSEDSFTRVEDVDAEWCQVCVDNNTWTCVHCNLRCGGRRALNLDGSRSVCTNCEDQYFRCEGCSTLFPNNVGETILVREEESLNISSSVLCNACIPVNHVSAWCEYFYLEASRNTRDCGCRVCNVAELEHRGQERLFDDPVSRMPPEEYAAYVTHELPEGPMPMWRA